MVKKKSDNYQLNIQGIYFWVRYFSDNKEQAYTKGSIRDDYYLYMQRIKDDKYIDYITNRVFNIQEDGDYLIIWPSGVKIPKNRLEICNDIEYVFTKIMDNDNKMAEYFTISEEIIYENYFCDELAYYYGLDVIPASYVDESIEYVKVNCSDDTYNRGRKLVQ